MSFPGLVCIPGPRSLSGGGEKGMSKGVHVQGWYVQVVGTSPGHGPEAVSTHPLLLTPNGSHHTYSRQVGEWNAFLFLQRSDLLMASLCLSFKNSHTKNGWYF